ncbi:hypothetical protein BBK82_38070 [Lentzea guizhouensis]|uniref:Uncharacterized protein n=1 Tax=Lentzea guizhouensis TaxID=1586287 RepID=A0A1B2HT98_9PSEU|nr:hypothetical protein [Lentzea guizhouensis]ANZ40933.1 hypothetical protein BBK82_38070 [Lentzea guizhouensis]
MTANRLDALMRAQLLDVLVTAKDTSGGSMDNEVNDWHVRPTEVPSCTAVTTTTPLQKCDSARRKSAGATIVMHGATIAVDGSITSTRAG